ncbi:hypothetical protein FGG08_004865 [Glutinoglossum americanum]|uniref:Uncharacterized protein n=1 Tax=Glutinoglossum americanum TaxID=1670608 RepID=A0A9P8L2A6_9PEZI|nr:hypothetical protein FGG08_004865 [Glutinoglossum americanum]
MGVGDAITEDFGNFFSETLEAAISSQGQSAGGSSAKRSSKSPSTNDDIISYNSQTSVDSSVNSSAISLNIEEPSGVGNGDEDQWNDWASDSEVSLEEISNLDEDKSEDLEKKLENHNDVEVGDRDEVGNGYNKEHSSENDGGFL